MRGLLDELESETFEGKDMVLTRGGKLPMRPIIHAATALVLWTAFQLHAAGAQETHALSLPQLEGSWSCEGYFIRNKRPIASNISVTRDVGNGALLLHHDDKPPALYHSLEVWSVSKDGSLKSSISDVYGMRWFTAQGWDGNGLKLNRTEGGSVVEQFTYAFRNANTLELDWAISRSGRPLTIGDTLTCHRTG
ncbi:hypothetical protein [Gluconacetobacter asukensis]|uniref:DUF1579 domain-containing protein n=1 Tax=Gluconacetobacter asukensis TaxID=1017181 RepID=A0A7W4IYX0_9PROT|nr:hypothetical protein [Gluconacetobacter asukensis]MBB2171577.1 hypothetical protein [Gluconacetobacter asukensis]